MVSILFNGSEQNTTFSNVQKKAIWKSIDYYRGKINWQSTCKPCMAAIYSVLTYRPSLSFLLFLFLLLCFLVRWPLVGGDSLGVVTGQCGHTQGHLYPGHGWLVARETNLDVVVNVEQQNNNSLLWREFEFILSLLVAATSCTWSHKHWPLYHNLLH